MTQAPFFADVAQAPDGAVVHWLTTADGTRIRAAAWGASEGTAPQGTVLLFPGRTEYIEKYGPSATQYTNRGFAFATVDWRGQGLADRATDDPRLGHVDHFDEFQRDVDAFLAFAETQALPRPWFLVGHSMGGCIGLRALHRGIGVQAAGFSAPMWGMEIALHMVPVAWLSAFVGSALGLGKTLTPNTEIESYAATEPFEDNMLTTDPEMFAFMKTQLDANTDLALGGPTLGWLRAAFVETTRLRFMAPPATPSLTFLGTSERIVKPGRIHHFTGRWPNGELVLIDGAEHEIMMEQPATRLRFYDETTALFVRHA